MHLIINYKRAGLKVDAAIMQVGAVITTDGGETLGEFQVSVKLSSLGSSDPLALNWWINNEDTRKNYLEAKKESISQAAYLFNRFIISTTHDPQSLKVWSNVPELADVTLNFINNDTEAKPKLDREQFLDFGTIMAINGMCQVPFHSGVTALDFANNQADHLIRLLS